MQSKVKQDSLMQLSGKESCIKLNLKLQFQTKQSKPVGKEWAEKVSRPFAKYFKQLADAKQQFGKDTSSDNFDYIASVSAFD